MVSKNAGELYAAIDMGSNSFHMMVVRLKDGHVQILNKIKQKVRLASGLDDHNLLDQRSIERGLACLRTFAERLQDIPQENVKAVATATLRIAKNSQDFVDQAQAILGCPINVISGLEEAKQIYMGVAYTSSQADTRLVIDIGGASTELIVGEGNQPLELDSLNMGCVTFSDRYFANGELSRDNFDNALAAAKSCIDPVLERFTRHNWAYSVGASGTPQAVSEILVAQQVNDSIRLNYLYELMELCIASKRIDTLAIDGLSDDRKHIFHSGLVILIALFESLEIDNMQLSGGALREGLLYGMLETREQRTTQLNGLQVISDHFHIDTGHAEHVAALATELFAKCPQTLHFDADAVLDGAARLHEIGLHIDYKHAHKHAEYILNHTKLHGYTTLQQQCICDLVAHFRQEIPTDIMMTYSDTMRPSLLLLLRILRVAIAFSIRRQDLSIPSLELSLNNDEMSITCPKGWLPQHPLVNAELHHEKWLQHKAGFTLTIS